MKHKLSIITLFVLISISLFSINVFARPACNQAMSIVPPGNDSPPFDFQALSIQPLDNIAVVGRPVAVAFSYRNDQNVAHHVEMIVSKDPSEGVPLAPPTADLHAHMTYFYGTYCGGAARQFVYDTPGDYHPYIALDPNNRITETNENNNVASTTIHVYPTCTWQSGTSSIPALTIPQDPQNGAVIVSDMRPFVRLTPTTSTDYIFQVEGGSSYNYGQFELYIDGNSLKIRNVQPGFTTGPLNINLACNIAPTTTTLAVTNTIDVTGTVKRLFSSTNLADESVLPNMVVKFTKLTAAGGLTAYSAQGTTNTDGQYTISLASPNLGAGNYKVNVTSPTYNTYERITYTTIAPLVDSTLNVNVTPVNTTGSQFSMDYYNIVGRGAAPYSVRFEQQPAYYIDVTPAPPSNTNPTTAQINFARSIITGSNELYNATGHFVNNPTISQGTNAPNTGILFYWDNTIPGSGGTGVSGTNGVITFAYSAVTTLTPLGGVYRHELGHAIGLTGNNYDLSAVASVYNDGTLVLTPLFQDIDKMAGKLLYNRPPCSYSPDADPNPFAASPCTRPQIGPGTGGGSGSSSILTLSVTLDTVGTFTQNFNVPNDGSIMHLDKLDKNIKTNFRLIKNYKDVYAYYDKASQTIKLTDNPKSKIPTIDNAAIIMQPVQPDKKK